jgi:hypothetical protein
MNICVQNKRRTIHRWPYKFKEEASGHNIHSNNKYLKKATSIIISFYCKNLYVQFGGGGSAVNVPFTLS